MEIDALISSLEKFEARYEAHGAVLALFLLHAPMLRQKLVLSLPHQIEQWIDLGLSPAQVEVARQEVLGLAATPPSTPGTGGGNRPPD